MAFFPRSFYHNHNSEGSFHPLFRFLDDFDNYSRQGEGHGRRLGLPTWQPKFDIRETADAYELHGEFPGLEKDNVHIDFSDPQTMQIRGKVERTYTAGTPPAGHLEGTQSGKTITEGEGEKSKSHKATVEDENAQENSEQTQDKASEDKSADQPAEKAPNDRAKYWLTERSIGEFSRSFSFPTRVEQDGVSANLTDGILTVTVPKAKKHESRRIEVN